MARVHLLAPLLVAIVGLAALWHALTTFDGAMSMTDSPLALEPAEPMPTQMRYLRVQGASLIEGSAYEVRVMSSERNGPPTVDHVYYVSRWQRGGEAFDVTTPAAPHAGSQLLGVYHPVERTLVAGASGASIGGLVRNAVMAASLLVVFGLLGLWVGLRSEGDANPVSSRSAPVVAGFRSSARAERVHELRRTTSASRAAYLFAAAGATFGISLIFAAMQLGLDPYVGVGTIFQITPVFVLPVLLYMAIHDRVTITVRRGSVERRGLTGWPARLAVEAGDVCVLRQLAYGRTKDPADSVFSVEIQKEGARFRIARVAGLEAATQLAARMNELLADANRE